MVSNLGTLRPFPSLEHPELLAVPVTARLRAIDASSVGVAEIDPTLSDTAAFCAAYEVGIHEAANCVVLEATRGDKSWYAACVVLGSTRADVNGLARRTLAARRVSFAPMEKAVAETGMEYGAITPIGLPGEWTILVDAAVAATSLVVIGSGIRKSKLILPGSVLTSLPNAQVLEGLGQTPKETHA